jgi:hypothetical protein
MKRWMRQRKKKGVYDEEQLLKTYSRKARGFCGRLLKVCHIR